MKAAKAENITAASFAHGNTRHILAGCQRRTV
jgi:hypothetical protein